MSFFTEYDERTGVCFQLTPEEVKVFAEALAGGGTKEKRTLEGQSETQLRYLLKGQVIDDAAYLAELKARGDSDSEAQGKLRQAKAVPNTTAEVRNVNSYVEGWRAGAAPAAGATAAAATPSPSAMGPAGRTYSQITGTDYLNDAERAWYLGQQGKTTGTYPPGSIGYSEAYPPIPSLAGDPNLPGFAMQSAPNGGPANTGAAPLAAAGAAQTTSSKKDAAYKALQAQGFTLYNVKVNKLGQITSADYYDPADELIHPVKWDDDLDEIVPASQQPYQPAKEMPLTRILSEMGQKGGRAKEGSPYYRAGVETPVYDVRLGGQAGETLRPETMFTAPASGNVMNLPDLRRPEENEAAYYQALGLQPGEMLATGFGGTNTMGPSKTVSLRGPQEGGLTQGQTYTFGDMYREKYLPSMSPATELMYRNAMAKGGGGQAGIDAISQALGLKTGMFGPWSDATATKLLGESGGKITSSELENRLSQYLEPSKPIQFWDEPEPVALALGGSGHAGISPVKARLMLSEGEVRGEALSEKQRGLFGAIASGYPLRKYAGGGSFMAQTLPIQAAAMAQSRAFGQQGKLMGGGQGSSFMTPEPVRIQGMMTGRDYAVAGEEPERIDVTPVGKGRRGRAAPAPTPVGRRWRLPPSVADSMRMMAWRPVFAA